MKATIFKLNKKADANITEVENKRQKKDKR